jgi:molybdopterin synthase catalytic subunit
LYRPLRNSAISVIISASSSRRLEACEWAIRELKRTVPIWKKEVFADGEVWVESDYLYDRAE